MNVQKLVLIFLVLSIFVTKSYGFGEIVITEIMADPSPAVGLPESEYIELYNNSASQILLKDYRFYSGDKYAVLPDYSFQPGEYLILIPISSKDLFESDFKSIALSGFPVLSNQGKLIYLEDSSGNIIFSLEYNDSWYKSSFKKQGGWSLECIDKFNFSGNINNWCASISNTGGSPGKENSVSGLNPDIIKPIIEKIILPDNKTIELSFNCMMSKETIDKNYNYSFLGGNNIVVRAGTTNHLCKSVNLQLSDVITDQVYRLKVSGLSSAGGNEMKDTVIALSWPITPEFSDISINEIMFNPKNTGSDFVEIVNVSEKCLNLADVLIASVKEDGTLSEGIRLSAKSSPFMPGSYLLISGNPDSVYKSSGHAKTANSIEISGFPTMSDDFGSIVILRKDALILDRFDYNKKMHISLLSNTEGVSLEKINPKMESSDEKNWTSASYTSNYSTPGFRNSQFKELNSSAETEIISSEKKWFTPDNDGNDDVLTLNVNNPINGIAEITVYNLSGRLVNVLVNKKLLSAFDTIFWDGKNSEGDLVSKGRYIINAILVSGDGKILNKRFSVSVL